MTLFVGLLIAALVVIIAIQIGRVTELSARIRGEAEVEQQNNNKTAFWLVAFMVAFLIACVWSAYYYKDVMMGYGPWVASSKHGVEVDALFNTTLVLTGIVFVITHVLLFWYAYKYRGQVGQKAVFLPHNTTLELVWTAIPAVAMAYLVAGGLVVWNDVMPDVGPDDEFLEIEATGYQFAWDIRYPGPDGKLGTKDFRLIDPASNSLGLDFNDPKTYDDVILGGGDKIVIPVDTLVRVRITAKDVLHNFYLPHFRVKMDAVPGLPTYFVFTPTKTTAEMRLTLKEYPEWNELSDPTDPTSPKRWETFEYELACAELCGIGHYSMRRILEVVDKETYKTWEAGLVDKSFYKNSVRGTDLDPNKGKRLLDFEIMMRERELQSEMEPLLMSASKGETLTTDIIRFKNVFFGTGSSSLEAESNYELDYAASILNKYPDISLEVAGHTDNIGDPIANRALSKGRADVVMQRLLSKGVSPNRLTSVGYGDGSPLESNDTEDGRAANRRTELRVISK